MLAVLFLIIFFGLGGTLSLLTRSLFLAVVTVGLVIVGAVSLAFNVAVSLVSAVLSLAMLAAVVAVALVALFALGAGGFALYEKVTGKTPATDTDEEDIEPLI